MLVPTAETVSISTLNGEHPATSGDIIFGQCRTPDFVVWTGEITYKLRIIRQTDCPGTLYRHVGIRRPPTLIVPLCP